MRLFLLLCPGQLTALVQRKNVQKEKRAKHNTPHKLTVHTDDAKNE